MANESGFIQTATQHVDWLQLIKTILYKIIFWSGFVATRIAEGLNNAGFRVEAWAIKLLMAAIVIGLSILLMRVAKKLHRALVIIFWIIIIIFFAGLFAPVK